MTWIVTDVEATGPAPMLGSLVSLGAVVVEPGLTRTFFGQTRPICEAFDQSNYDAIGVTREEHLTYPDPAETITAFARWLEEVGAGRRVTFVSDNLAYDWQWTNYYLHRYAARNPFGFSGRRIGDLYAGFKGNASTSSEWKKLRQTRHTHHPVDDAKGNAEALLAIQAMGLKMPQVPA